MFGSRKSELLSSEIPALGRVHEAEKGVSTQYLGLQ